MTKSTALLSCLLLLASHALFAQKDEAKPRNYKFGKVDLKEFATKVSGPDSAASAVVLFDIGKGYFEFSSKHGGFIYVFERHTRYKIINKLGVDHGDLELTLYKSSNGETMLQQMDASTYNLTEDGKVVISKIGKDAKFSEKKDKNYTVRKFALPNVKEGSICEYKYRIQSDFVFTLRPWYFQREIPTLYSEYQVTIPEYYRYKVNGGGFVFLNPKQEHVNQTFLNNQGSVSLECLKTTYQAENIPGLKTENYITTMRDYVSKVEFELASVMIPGQVYQDYTSTWPKVIIGLKEDANFGQFLNKKNIAKSILNEKLKLHNNKDTALVQIFDYVKGNIKWDNNTSIYTSATSPKVVTDRRSGNSADINLILAMLLKEANISAYPVLVSTRENGAHPGFPMLSGFDNVIVAVQVADQFVLLDATDKNHTLDLISFENLNHHGLLTDMENETSKWIPIEDNRLSKRAINYVLKINPETKQLTGKLFLSSSNYSGLNRRRRYQAATNQEDFLKSYKTDKPGMGIKGYEISNLDNPGEPLIESMDVTIEDNIDEAGNLSYFTPLLFERTKENPFKLEERKFPVDFAYPNEEVYRITLEIPEGYQLDKTPKNERVTLPEEKAAFSFLCVSEDNRLMLTSKITIKKSVFSPEEYEELKELFKNIVRKQAEQIVIKKI